MTLPAVRRQPRVFDANAYVLPEHKSNDLAALFAIAPTANPTWYRVQVPIVVGGNIYSRPVHSIAYPGGSDYAITEMQVANLSLPSVPTIDIVAGFTPGSTILIDCDALKVTINSVIADYLGAFPLLDPQVNGGTNVIEFRAYGNGPFSLFVATTWTSRWAS